MFIFINRYTVNGDRAEFLGVLDKISAYMADQPGLRSHTLYHSAKDETVYVEIAEWTDPGSHRAAFGGAVFQELLNTLKTLATADPGPFTKVAR